MDSQNKNTILAIALSVLVLIGWQFFYVNPKLEAERKAAEVAAQRQQEQASQLPAQTPGATGNQAGIPAPQAGGTSIPSASQPGAIPGDPTVAGVADRAAALGQDQRIPFSNSHITGSLNLKGARIDDLDLNDYRVTISKTSPAVTLLNPSAMENGYFAEFGYSASADSGAVPGPDTVWKVAEGDKLTPSTPLKLEWTNEKGVTFRRTVSVDDEYLFTYTDEIANGTGAPVTVFPYGRITRFGTPNTANIYVLHEGLLGVLGEEGLLEVDYDEAVEGKQITGESEGSYPNGWIGITDKYWATAIVPGGAFKPRFSHFDQGRPRYQSDYLGDAVAVAAGSSAQVKQQLFAGAKETRVIDRYEAENNILNFDLLIDWGWFYFITKPLFYMLDYIFSVIGNFGVAILIGTVIIKAFLFPLANMSYASMAKMKKVQPEMQRIKEAAGDDRVKMQQDMMALYKKEKINPAAGCWPILIQIPIFFALYKVIYVTIEMRHAPFFGWIQDLSAPDPTSVFNLFGLLPYDVPLFLMIGVWPLLMGITMFLQMQMNPAPPDPTQQMIFKWMPVVFTFMLATFPAGLVIYWAWNNTLSIIQQGIIMRKHGAKIELLDNLKGLFSRSTNEKEGGK